MRNDIINYLKEEIYSRAKKPENNYRRKMCCRC